jgi:hypothetical protein
MASFISSAVAGLPADPSAATPGFDQLRALPEREPRNRKLIVITDDKDLLYVEGGRCVLHPVVDTQLGDPEALG